MPSFTDFILQSLGETAKHPVQTADDLIRHAGSKLGADQLSALANASWDHAANITLGKGETKTFGQRYDEALANEKLKNIQVEERSPMAGGIGDIGGTVLSIAGPTKFFKPAGVVGRIGTGALGGGTSTSLSSPEPIGTKANTMETLGGTILGGAGEVVPPVVTKAGTKFLNLDVRSRSGLASQQVEEIIAKNQEAAAARKVAEDAADKMNQEINTKGLLNPDIEVAANYSATKALQAKQAEYIANKTAEKSIKSSLPVGVNINEVGAEMLNELANHMQWMPGGLQWVARARFGAQFAKPWLEPILQSDGFQTAAKQGQKGIQAWMAEHGDEPEVAKIMSTIGSPEFQSQVDEQIKKARTNPFNAPQDVLDQMQNQPVSQVPNIPTTTPGLDTAQPQGYTVPQDVMEQMYQPQQGQGAQ